MKETTPVAAVFEGGGFLNSRMLLHLCTWRVTRGMTLEAEIIELLVAKILLFLPLGDGYYYSRL